MTILLFSFLVLLYYYYLGCGIRSGAEDTLHIPHSLDESSATYLTEFSSNPQDQFEVHLQYPRVAHPMFWMVLVLLEPDVFLPFQLRQ